MKLRIGQVMAPKLKENAQGQITRVWNVKSYGIDGKEVLINSMNRDMSEYANLTIVLPDSELETNPWGKLQVRVNAKTAILIDQRVVDGQTNPPPPEKSFKPADTNKGFSSSNNHIQAPKVGGVGGYSSPSFSKRQYTIDELFVLMDGIVKKYGKTFSTDQANATLCADIFKTACVNGVEVKSKDGAVVPPPPQKNDDDVGF